MYKSSPFKTNLKGCIHSAAEQDRPAEIGLACVCDFFWPMLCCQLKICPFSPRRYFKASTNRWFARARDSVSCEASWHSWSTGLSSHHAPVPCCSISVVRKLLQSIPRPLRIHKVTGVHRGQPLLCLWGFAAGITSGRRRLPSCFHSRPLTMAGR